MPQELGRLLDLVHLKSRDVAVALPSPLETWACAAHNTQNLDTRTDIIDIIPPTAEVPNLLGFSPLFLEPILISLSTLSAIKTVPAKDMVSLLGPHLLHAAPLSALTSLVTRVAAHLYTPAAVSRFYLQPRSSNWTLCASSSFSTSAWAGGVLTGPQTNMSKPPLTIPCKLALPTTVHVLLRVTPHFQDLRPRMLGHPPCLSLCGSQFASKS